MVAASGGQDAAIPESTGGAGVATGGEGGSGGTGAGGATPPAQNQVATGGAGAVTPPQIGTGGAVATSGGAPVVGTGGTPSSGGAPATGGSSGTGGATMTCANTCGVGMQCLGGQCCQTPLLSGSCNIPTCGCAAGQVCSPVTSATGATELACTTPTPGLGIRQDCRNGLICPSDTGCIGGICKPYCEVDIVCTAVAGIRKCSGASSSSSGTVIPGVSFCRTICDPVLPQTPGSPLPPCPAGFRCDPSPDSSSDCSPGGLGGAGQACQSTSDCSPGYFCDGNTCHKYCATANDCASLMGCLEFDPPVRIGTVPVGFCGLCDPVKPQTPRNSLSRCPTGYGCYVVDSSVNPQISRCYSSNNVAAGQPCGHAEDCQPGYYCSSGTATCRKYCASNSDCASVASTTCKDFTTPEIVNGLPVRACL